MCGLCGIYHSDGAPVDFDVMQRMLGAIRHRGPDSEGSFRASNGISLALGSRRLSIIDLSEAGGQPMLNEDGTVALVWNGEIYNFQALRAELEAKGHRFRSQGDTEVIVHLYEEEGPGAISRLDGMFALALWDGRRRELVLARDRAGKKPLYYYRNGPVVAFASELPAILEHPGVDRRMNPRALPLYLTYGYVPCPETFYAHIYQVPPATYLVLKDGQVRGPVSYWTLRFPRAGEELRIDADDARRHVRRLVTDAVRKRLVADVPIGVFLSGGIDSSIVTALTSRILGERVKTFSIGFAGDDSYDERAYARIVARQFDTDHTEFVVRPDAVSLVDKLVDHYGQPFGDSSAVPTYIVAQLTRRHVTVVLTGDGGDEQFAGYERFLAGCLAETMPDSLVAAAQSLTWLLPRGARHGFWGARVRRFLRQARRPLDQRYLAWNSFIDADILPHMLDRHANGFTAARIAESFTAYLDETRDCHVLNRLLDLNYRTYLLDDLLVKTDRMTMAHGLEARCPFLDTALTEFVAALPPSLKIRGRRLKHVLKEAFHDLLPGPILQRGKHGFGMPLGAWFAGELRDYVYDTLLAPSARIRDMLNGDSVRAIYADHAAGRRDYGHQLWALLTLELWLRKQHDPGRVESPKLLPRAAQPAGVSAS